MIERFLSARSILLDSNLLVLQIVGSLDRTLIGRHKRTRAFTEEDFVLLTRLLEGKTAIVTTPNILTEVSNLLLSGRKDRRDEALMGFLRQLVELLDEQYVQSETASALDCFSRLGLTDSALVTGCDGGTVLLTTDLGLYLEATRRDLFAFNFNHIREGAWD